MRVLVTVLAAASVARAQDKPRVGQDGRPLLNKPKVWGEKSQGSTVHVNPGGDVHGPEVPREVRPAPLFPVLAGTLEQVRGLGLVQREELLPGALHGPRVLRGPGGVQTLRQDDAQRWDGDLDTQLTLIMPRLPIADIYHEFILDAAIGKRGMINVSGVEQYIAISNTFP